MAETVRFLRVRVMIDAYVVGDDGAKLINQVNIDETMVDGTGANQVGSVFWDDARALATTSEDLDLSGGLTDFQGAALALNNFKLLFVQGLDEDSGDGFKIKPGSTAPVTSFLEGTSPELNVGPGGFVLAFSPVDGYAVTDTSADKLAIESLDSSSYRIIIAGDNEA